MLQLRRSSSQICCSREDYHLKYFATKKIFIFNMLQSRRSSSPICCSREGGHLKSIAVEKRSSSPI
uniref:Uncharacterized protein n=1 Tax=Cucumis melo TaxID=3656 RepID=A0A9I9DQ35_CUCME